MREEICKRFKVKRFRPVMYLEGILQQGVPIHRSTKRSQLPSSNNCLVQAVKAKAQRVCYLEQTPKTPNSSPCKSQSQQVVRLTHTQFGMLGQLGNIFFWSPIFYVFIFCKFLYFPFQAEYFTLMPLVPSQLHSIQENHFLFQPVLYPSLLKPWMVISKVPKVINIQFEQLNSQIDLQFYMHSWCISPISAK